MKFRADINGLRAIAVIAVVLFHFNSNWVPGGFAGVDVFFVISGFLMTSIIFKGLQNNSFSIANFYVARANRIIPALSVVCITLLVFGWFYIIPIDYRELGKHVINSLVFISNIIYSQESGYFATPSHGKWLLHTWSLSVEWQFYLIYPVVLVLLKKYFSLGNIKKLLFSATIIGYIFCVYATYHWPDSSYYLLPMRAWEMMLGGLAFIYPFNIKSINKKYFEWIGITLILISYIFISKNDLWPGYLAIIPVFGTYLVLIANRQSGIITNNYIFQKVGLWSYSIYLWHWPIVVFGFYFDIQNWVWIGIPLSFLLGYLSYKFVENKKLPKISSVTFRSIATFKPLLMVISIGLTANFIYKNNGFDSRLSPELMRIQKYAEDLISAENTELKELINQCDVKDLTSKNCNQFTSNIHNLAAIIIGDSHAASTVSGIYYSLNKVDKHKQLLNLGAYGCLPIKGIVHSEYKRRDCPLYNDRIYDFLERNYKGTPVILASRLNLYPFGFNEDNEINKPYIFFDGYKKYSQSYLEAFESHFIDSMCNISKNHPVFIVKPTPEFPVNVPNEMIKKTLLRQSSNISMPKSSYYSRNKFTTILLNKVRKQCGVNIIDVNKAFLSKDGKRYKANINDTPLFADANHLNIYGARLLSDDFDFIWHLNLNK